MSDIGASSRDKSRRHKTNSRSDRRMSRSRSHPIDRSGELVARSRSRSRERLITSRSNGTPPIARECSSYFGRYRDSSRSRHDRSHEHGSALDRILSLSKQ